MSEKFIDKSRLNVDNSTNAAAIASLVAAASIVGDGLHRHPSEFFAWGPQAIGLVVAAFSQWLQGVPSKDTKLIKNIFNLDGDTNADVVRSAIARIANTGSGNVVGGMGDSSMGDRGRDAGLHGLSDDGRDHYHRGNLRQDISSVASPETILAAWGEADRVRNKEPISETNVTPSQNWRMAQFGDSADNSYSMPVPAQGDESWLN